MIEHHEHNESQSLFRPKIKNGDCGKEIVPIHISAILEIEDFIQSIDLLLRIAFKLRK
jgi:hypothetical protein